MSPNLAYLIIRPRASLATLMRHSRTSSLSLSPLAAQTNGICWPEGCQTNSKIGIASSGSDYGDGLIELNRYFWLCGQQQASLFAADRKQIRAADRTSKYTHININLKTRTSRACRHLVANKLPIWPPNQ